MNFIKMLTNKLRDHKVIDFGLYRFKFLEYNEIKSVYGPKFDETNVYVFKEFTFPYGMSKEDAFKVISFLLDSTKLIIKADTGRNVDVANKDVIKHTDKALGLAGFNRIKDDAFNNFDGVTDLYLVSGNLKKFKKSSEYKKYFNWYVDDVTEQDVEEIYKSIGSNINLTKILCCVEQNIMANSNKKQIKQ